MPTAVIAAPNLPANAQAFTIEQASKACGLSPGVLRMWEARYGWPRPDRHANGYRSFSRFGIEELIHMAALVRSGLLIGGLIREGVPVWPDAVTRPVHRPLPATQALPAPLGDAAVAVRDQLVAALLLQDHGRAWEMLQRCAWEIHPAQQLLAGWLPCLVALEEYRAAGRPMARQEQLEEYLQQRMRASLGSLPPTARPLWVAPTSAGETCLAHATAVLLSQQGRVARPWLWDIMPSTARYVSVGSAPFAAGSAPGGRHEGHLALIDLPGTPGLTALAAGADAGATAPACR